MGYIFGDNGSGSSSAINKIKGADPSVVIPAGTFVIALIIKTTANQHVTLGLTEGGNEIFEGDVLANKDYEVVIHKKYEEATVVFIAGDHTPDISVNVEVIKL